MGSKQDKGRDMMANLTDWRFDRYLTMQLLPLFYLVLVIAAAVLALVTVAMFFQVSILAGITALVAAPFGFLVAFAIIRAALEYLVMAHRIMRIIERMDSIQDKVGGMSVQVEHMDKQVAHIVKEVATLTDTVAMLKPILESTTLPRRILRKAWPGKQAAEVSKPGVAPAEPAQTDASKEQKEPKDDA